MMCQARGGDVGRISESALTKSARHPPVDSPDWHGKIATILRLSTPGNLKIVAILGSGSSGAECAQEGGVPGDLQDVERHPAEEGQQQVAGRTPGQGPGVVVVAVQQRVRVEQG